MKRIRFGLYERGALTGADIAVRVMQICAVAASIFTFITPGYLSLFTKRGVLSTLFELGISSMSRAFTVGLSYVYRLTGSEPAMHFALLGGALVFGLVMNALLRGKPKAGIAARVVFALLILL